MSFTYWLSNHLGRSPRPASRRKTPTARPSFRPTLEALENRWVPSTLTVRNNHDSGADSLRADIAAAHNGDTIVFAPSLAGQTITLNSGELLIKKNLTITGLGSDSLTISGNSASRVFEVAKNETVTLSGLTIKNGSAVGAAAAGHGGAIENYGTLTVSSCTLSNNTVFGGGGIYNELTGSLTVGNCTLTGNYASNAGGGINADGPVTISNSVLSNNSTGFDEVGGGIITGGTMTITSSTLSGNSAGAGGGAIENVGTLTVSNCTLSGNSARQGEGGGIESGGTLTVSGSKLLNNSAGIGGGISASGTVTVSSSTLTGNSATSLGGGGIFVQNGTLTLGDSTLSGNSASEGGAIFVNGSGTATLTNDTMESNTATSYGGGIYIVPAAGVKLDSFTVANIINNTDSSGGSTANIDGMYTLLQ